MAATILTAPFHGYQVLFSPYSPHKVAFTGAQNYGIAGEDATSYQYTTGSLKGRGLKYIYFRLNWAMGRANMQSRILLDLFLFEFANQEHANDILFCTHFFLQGSGVLILYEEDQDGFRECRRSVMS